MRSIRRTLLVTLMLTAWAEVALALPEMQVTGSVDANGDFSPESNLSDLETGEPFVRPTISVTDQLTGTWEYFARVDSTVPQIQIFGTFANNTGSVLGNRETPVLSVNGRLRDTLTLTPTFDGPYRVSIDMLIDGVMVVDGSDGRAAAGLQVIPTNQVTASRFRQYTTSGAVMDDLLNIQYQFSGEAVFDLSTSLFFSVTRIDPGVTVSGDFRNTAIINLTITDLSGAPLTREDVAVSSGSGYFDTAPVPVPPALPLLVSAVVGLGWWRRGSSRLQRPNSAEAPVAAA